LIQSERPNALALTDPHDRQERLAIVDQRIERLQSCLRSAEVVQPPPTAEACVRFGATVTARDGRGVASSYRIVGADEIEIDRGWVSWLSPIAKALLNMRVGQKVRFKTPSGEEELEIIAVEYL